MNNLILFLVFNIFIFPVFSQVQQKEMLVFNFININGKNDTKKIHFYHSNLVFVEYSPSFKREMGFYQQFQKGIYSFFSGTDSMNIEHNNEQLVNMMNVLSQSEAKAYHSLSNNVAYLSVNKELKKDIFWSFYAYIPKWAGKNLYIEVFQAKISYVYVGKTECLLPNFKYNKRTRKKEPLMIPLVCNAYEIVGVEYFKPYKLNRKRIRLR
jgi:hypothetical protein